MRTRMPLAALVLLGGLALAHAQDPKGDKAKAPDPAAKAAYDAAKLGTDLWNRGNHEGCFRLYQGALIGLLPSLENRPEVAKVVRDRLDRAKTMDAVNGAVLLREGLDAVMGVPAGGAAGKKANPLWDRLGGEKAVRAVVHDFVVAIATDPKVDVTRGGKYKLDAEGVKKLEELLVQQISEVTGGPLKYTGRDMKTVHKGMKITEAEFNAAAGHLIATLKKYNVGQAEIDELLTIIATTKKDIVEGPDPGGKPADTKEARKPLWERLGGEKAVKAVVHDTVASAATDPKVDFTRGGKYKLDEKGVEKLEQLLVEMISANTGGPLKYSGRDMKTAHAGMKITDAEFTALLTHLAAALQKHKVPLTEMAELLEVVGTTRKDIVGQ